VYPLASHSTESNSPHQSEQEVRMTR